VRRLRQIHGALRTLLRPRRSERDLDADAQSWIDLLVEEKMSQGLSLPEARRQAQLEFGSVLKMKQMVRERRNGATIAGILQDIVFGLRGLVRQRWFAVAAIVSVAVGIGASTTVYGIAHTLLDNRPKGVPHPEELVTPVMTYDRPGVWGEGYPQFMEMRDQQDVLADMALYNRRPAVVSTGQAADVVNLQISTGSYFNLLGVKPAIGRTLDPKDDQDGSPHEAVISFTFWRARLGGDPGVVGQLLKVNGVPFRIAGVMPADFRDVERDYYSPPDVWLSFHALYSEQFLQRTRTAGSRIIGRLRPGVTLAAAQARFKSLVPRISVDPKDLYRLQDIDLVPSSAAQIAPYERRETAGFLGILFGVCILIELTACFSVAGFLITRATARREEMAVRIALGATRSRIVRQLMTESLLLGGGATALGLVIAGWLLKGLAHLPPVFTRMPTTAGFTLDGNIVGFAALMMLGSSALFGLIPALLASNRDPFMDLKRSEAGWTWAGVRITARQILLAGQIGLTAALAVTAGLYARSLARIARIDAGYPTASMLLVRVNPQALGAARIPPFYRTLLDRLNSRSDVVSASIVWNPPFQIGTRQLQPADEPSSPVTSYSTAVAPKYFETLGVRLLAGREFDGSEQDSGNALIVNRVLADKLWPGQDAVGRAIMSGPRLEERRVVVGVVDMAKCGDLFEDAGQCAWIPFPWNSGSGYLRIRTQENPMAFLPLLRGLIREIQPDVAIAEAMTLNDHLANLTAQPRLAAEITGLLAILGIGLVMISCFSLIASMVRDSRRELAIRIALGAPGRRLSFKIASRGVLLGLAGVAIGLPASIPIANYLADQLFQVSPLDGLTYTVVGAGIVGICLVASYIPARTAVRIDPAVNLHHD
jgi:predicted permease